MIRLAVRCHPELAEIALAELLEIAPGGVEEERGDGYVELAIYGSPGEIPDLGGVEAAVGDGLVDISTTEIPDDWADRWRDFHRPVEIASGRLTVRPSWHEPPPAASAAPAASGHPAPVEVVIDPGQAFGTGAHPTTRLCLELLLDCADRGAATGSLVDLGTGSGVLAIAAAKLGWSPVIAVDHQPAALDAAGANAAANGVAVELAVVNLRSEPPPTAVTVAANLTGPLLVEVAGQLADPPATLICSGLLATELDRVAAAFAPRGFEVTDRRRAGDWAALLLEPVSAGG